MLLIKTLIDKNLFDVMDEQSNRISRFSRSFMRLELILPKIFKYIF